MDISVIKSHFNKIILDTSENVVIEENIEKRSFKLVDENEIFLKEFKIGVKIIDNYKL